MPQRSLPIQEVKELCLVLREVFRYFQDLRNREPIARFIKNPQIPPALSESLALHLARNEVLIKDLRDWHFERGVGGRDLVATRDNNISIIEVKATSSKGWQRLSSKDVAADFLVWIDFGLFFESSEVQSIDVYVIPFPAKYYRAGEDVFVVEIRAKVGKALRYSKVDLEI